MLHHFSLLIRRVIFDNVFRAFNGSNECSGLPLFQAMLEYELPHKHYMDQYSASWVTFRTISYVSVTWQPPKSTVSEK